MATKMRLKTKNRSQRYDIDLDLDMDTNILKHKMCLSIMVVIHTKQQLSNI